MGKVKDGEPTHTLRRYPATGTPGPMFSSNRPPSTPERLILDVDPYVCCFCSTPEVFSNDQILRVPQQLEAKGVDQAAWERTISLLRAAVQDHVVSVSSLIVSLTILLPLICAIPIMRNLQKAVGKALDDLNREIYEPRGLFIKTQKSVWHQGKHSVETAWLSIALTPAECNILKEEPNVYVYSPFENVHIPNSDACCSESDKCCGVPIVV
eukprot:TRINITY_DN5577_c0_g2_i1.p1 TRINITY_DN5577_c0_g2~~TRINITY_DN5577_c0_g2_i1.p1  ORF type:complete len:211 (-),score=25.02 TRINITY_DN5577_c0_g2_i1:230-862(-)